MLTIWKSDRVALLLDRPYLRAGELLYLLSFIYSLFSIHSNLFRFPRLEIDNGTEIFVYTKPSV